VDAEHRLAVALEQIFRSGITDFTEVVSHLHDRGIALPSGAPGPWTPERLHDELAAINTSLDEAYLAGTSGA